MTAYGPTARYCGDPRVLGSTGGMCVDISRYLSAAIMLRWHGHNLAADLDYGTSGCNCTLPKRFSIGKDCCNICSTSQPY